MCRSMADIQSTAAEIRRGKKKDRKKKEGKKLQGKNIMAPLLHRAAIIIKLQSCHFDIVILRVAIISNVQNVSFQRQDRLTDDASTRRWRGSQQANNDTFITALATHSLSNK